MQGFSFPKGMLLGAASAATQIEGGDRNNSWYDWYEKGRIHDGSSPAVANDHYARWREDADLMAELGIETYRFGVEWSRIEPEQGRFEEAALAHYREEAAYLVSCGIRPLLTLHHFTNPLWFERMGAFENPESEAVFLRFAEKVVRAMGGLVSEYITINEPNVYAVNGYFFGAWPPGRRSFAATRAVMTRMAACHIRAYKMIHRVRREMGFSDTKVSFANHLRAFAPENPKNPWHRLAARLTETFFQGSLTRAMTRGERRFPVLRSEAICPGEYCDFIGVNYYTRSTVHGIGDGVRKGAPVNDLGWEIYPEGIAECAKKAYDLLPRPIYITENGTCDNADAFRARYILEHLKALAASGLPVERYYHWCFCDNFEWLEGQSARFGLIHIDYETQARTVKESGHMFAELIRAGGVCDALCARYAKQAYPRNGEAN